MSSPSLPILRARVTSTLASLERELEREDWVAARILAEELVAHTQQLEHRLWLQAELARADLERAPEGEP